MPKRRNGRYSVLSRKFRLVHGLSIGIGEKAILPMDDCRFDQCQNVPRRVILDLKAEATTGNGGQVCCWLWVKDFSN